MGKSTVYLFIFILLAFNALVLYLQNITFLMFFSVIFTCLAYISSGQKLRERITWIINIIIFLTALNLLLNGTADIRSMLYYTFLSVIRIYLISMSVLIFSEKISIGILLKSFDFLPKSYLFSSAIAYSMVPILFDEAKKIAVVQQSRGHNFKKINPFRSYLPIIIPLIHRAMKRSISISRIIVSRGFEV